MGSSSKREKNEWMNGIILQNDISTIEWMNAAEWVQWMIDWMSDRGLDEWIWMFACGSRKIFQENRKLKSRLWSNFYFQATIWYEMA